MCPPLITHCIRMVLKEINKAKENNELKNNKDKSKEG